MLDKILQEDAEQIISRIRAEECQGKTFLITGASGSIAGMVVYALLELCQRPGYEPCRVLALCRNEDKAEALFQDYLGRPYFQLLIQDVSEPVEYEGNIDYIIHAACNSSTGRFLSFPVEIITANLIGTYQLLELARKKECKAFLLLSSGSIYGDDSLALEDIKEDEYYPIDPLSVRSCYPMSKKAAETMCFCYFKQYQVPAKIIRIAHTYGPLIDLDDGHVYSDFIKYILNREDIVIKGDGLDKRPFCYVTDTAAAIFTVLFQGHGGQAYNVANNDCHISIRDLAEELVSRGFPQYHLNVCYPNGRPGPGKGRKEEVSICTKKLEELGWSPRVGVQEGFKRVIDHHESDKGGRSRGIGWRNQKNPEGERDI